MERININNSLDWFKHIGDLHLKPHWDCSTFKPLEFWNHVRVVHWTRKRKAIPKTVHNRVEKPSKQLCAYTSGPSKKSIIGSSYWILIVDEYIGKSWSFFTKTKMDISKVMDNLVFILKSLSGHFRKLFWLKCFKLAMISSSTIFDPKFLNY